VPPPVEKIPVQATENIHMPAIENPFLSSIGISMCLVEKEDRQRRAGYCVGKTLVSVIEKIHGVRALEKLFRQVLLTIDRALKGYFEYHYSVDHP
jgi:hypothetical protein